MEWSCQNDLLLNIFPLFKAEILFHYSWFQDHQIKGSCGQDLFCTLSVLCMMRGEGEGRHWGEERELEKIHYFLWLTLALAVHVALMFPLYLISFINTRHRHQSHSLDQLSHGSCSSIDLTFSLWSLTTLCLVSSSYPNPDELLL